MNENRYANVFSKDGVVYLFPWGLVEDRILTVDSCISKMPKASSPELIAEDLIRALEMFGRDIPVAEFKTRKDPLLAAIGQKSYSKLNAGLGHVEVGDLVSDGAIELIPHAAKGRASSPLIERRTRVSKESGMIALGMAIQQALDISSEYNSEK